MATQTIDCSTIQISAPRSLTSPAGSGRPRVRSTRASILRSTMSFQVQPAPRMAKAPIANSAIQPIRLPQCCAAAQRRRPPAGQHQQPGADRPVPARQPAVGPRPCRQIAQRPVLAIDVGEAAWLSGLQSWRHHGRMSRHASIRRGRLCPPASRPRSTRRRPHYLRHVHAARGGRAVCCCSTAATANGGPRSSLRGKKAAVAAVGEQTRAQAASPIVWLCFAPIKRARIDYIAEKATELGVAVLQPVITRHTAVERVNVERLRANAVEAAEQTERLSVPEVRAPVDLDALAGRLAGRAPAADVRRDRRRAADRRGAGAGSTRRRARAPWAIVIGPGGRLRRARA